MYYKKLTLYVYNNNTHLNDKKHIIKILHLVHM